MLLVEPVFKTNEAYFVTKYTATSTVNFAHTINPYLGHSTTLNHFIRNFLCW